jgi:phytoene dehydrogenase-like protein
MQNYAKARNFGQRQGVRSPVQVINAEGLSLRTHYDVVIIGSGHNGLVAAGYAAAAGLSVLVLEKNDYLGGATTSRMVFPDFDAMLSRYSYLISLFPTKITSDLGLTFATRRRSVGSFTPYTDPNGIDRGLLLSNIDSARSKRSIETLCGCHEAYERYGRFVEYQSAMAQIAWPSLLRPLCSRAAMKRSLKANDQQTAWSMFVESPLGSAIERHIENDLLRGVVFTDAKIGVLTHPHDESLIQNRCFLYHVIGQGTGEWQVPVGGMRSLIESLLVGGQKHGVEYRTHSQAQHVAIGGKLHTIEFTENDVKRCVDATYVLVNAGPRTFARLLNHPYSPSTRDEGSVVKVNMLLRRLPMVKAVDVTAEEAFTGSHHLNEGYEEMQQSFVEASAGSIPRLPPFELYCHTLTDSSILSPHLQDAGYQTLTLFGLDVPYRAFAVEHDQRKQLVLQRYMERLNQICNEPFESCLAIASDGSPCIEAKTPQELECELGLDWGNIFHNAPSWFFTDDESKEGRWGVETEYERVFLAGSSADRGGAVSGIPGHNAAMCLFDHLGIQRPE